MRKHTTDRHWKEQVKDMLSLHAGERRGTLILLVLCFLASGWVAYEQYIAPDEVGERAALEVVWAEMKAAEGSSIPAAQRSDRQRDVEALVLFDFDPNNLPVEQWVALGLSERQAAAIHRFEAKGGRFRTKKDVARMHVVDPELFDRWRGYILLPDSLPRRQFPGKDRIDHTTANTSVPKMEPDRPAEVVQVEINSADTSALVAVRGIGPAFARSIVKFRDRLGGFHSLDQLSEVYILRDKPEAVARLKEQLVLDEQGVRRFPLNTVTAEELGPHPYAGWKVAKALVAYRKQHGPFRSVDDIKGCVLVTDSVYRKLAPYLTLE